MGDVDQDGYLSCDEVVALMRKVGFWCHHRVLGFGFCFGVLLRVLRVSLRGGGDTEGYLSSSVSP